MLPKKVDQIINSIHHLRPMPSSVTRILKELDDPTVSANRITDLIGLDQALAALILQMSNSAGMGYARNCSSINDAVMRIGFKRIKSILLASSAAGPLTKRLSGYRLGAGELWQHSLAVAVTAEWIARTLRYPEPEEAYVSGLLHDIGKLLLDQFILTDYSAIVDFIRQYKMPLWQVEEKLLGIDHARVGGLMGEKWQFPVTMVDSIRYHHSPSFARTNQRLPAIINFANALAAQKNQNKSALFSAELHPESLIILNLSEAEVEKLRLYVNQEVLNVSLGS